MSCKTRAPHADILNTAGPLKPQCVISSGPLARSHGFVFVDDSQLRAAVRVSADEEETRIVAVEEIAGGRSEQDEEDEFRTLLVDVEPEEQRWRDN